MTTTQHMIPYDLEFFDRIRGTSQPSAEAVVPHLMRLAQPSTVVDIGCGEGAWLKEFLSLGVDDCVGVDGTYVQTERLLIPRNSFRQLDLRKPFALDRGFDLAISLEVAEHLPASSASGFVASLCKCAPVVAFSAAIPGQGGTDHLNEQWPRFWADLFSANGFDCYDVLRPILWGDERISRWYRQNLLIFAVPEAARASNLADATPTARPMPLVHPELFAHRCNSWDRNRFWLENPGIRQSATLFWRALLRRARGRVASQPV